MFQEKCNSFLLFFDIFRIRFFFETFSNNVLNHHIKIFSIAYSEKLCDSCI